MKRARLLIHRKEVDDYGNIVELKIWRVEPTEDKPFGLKYSLAYIVQGERVVGYDNAERKGDHRHIKGKEQSYQFLSVEQLVRDFFEDVEKIRKELYHGNQKKADNH